MMALGLSSVSAKEEDPRPYFTYKSRGDFGTLDEGYGDYNALQQSKNIGIHTRDMAINPVYNYVRIELTSGNTTAFRLNSIGGIGQNWEANKNYDCYVYLADDLTAGTYSATLTLYFSSQGTGSGWQAVDTCTLKAKVVAPEKYTMKFLPNGGSGIDKMPPRTFEDNEITNVEIPECAFDPPYGKYFDCWLLGYLVLRPGDTYTLTSKLTKLEANWKETVYKKDIPLADLNKDWVDPDPKNKVITKWEYVSTEPGKILKLICTTPELLKGDIVIPEKIANKSIISLDKYFCRNATEMTSISLPDGITEIGSWAFEGCSKLKSAKLPKKLTKLDVNAFQDCVALEEITVPSGVEELSGTFKGCSNLKKVKMPSKLKKLGSFTFADCALLESVTLPNNTGITEIPWSCFVRCYALKSVNIPPTVTEIDQEAFFYCTSLEKIILPDGLTEIGSQAFLNTALKNVIIPDGVTDLNSGCFAQCYDLKTARIPASVTYFNNPFSVNDTLLIYCYEGSDGHNYAINKGFNYQLIVPWDASKVTVTGLSQKTFTGKAITQSVKVFYDGAELINNQDYRLKYKNNINAGTATMTVCATGGLDGQKNFTFKITAKKITPTVTLGKDEYVYSGSAIKPAVTVKDGSTTIATANYTVNLATGRKNVGKYSVKITLKNNYSGTKTVYFKINPKSTTISSLTKASKAFTVKWKKQATQTTGYQIQYSTSSTFASGNKTVTITSNKTTSKKISKLKAKKKYYVRIRTYKSVSGTKYYSSWSAKKYVTTK
jgi:hypothetical protein